MWEHMINRAVYMLIALVVFHQAGGKIEKKDYKWGFVLIAVGLVFLFEGVTEGW